MIPRPPCFCAFSDSELPVKKLAGRRCDFCTHRKNFLFFVRHFAACRRMDVWKGERAQAQFASQEAAKVDTVWKTLFGSAKNSITIPAESTENAFDMSAAENG